MHNREEIKWAPFESLLKSENVLKELEKEKKFTSKKNLSSDELESLERKIKEAFHTHSYIEIEYYDQGFYAKKKGIISDILINHSKIFFQDHTSLYFEQILDIHFL